MSWTRLAERFTTLPLILSGPILRRVEPHAVTVWLALKESQKVTLRIYTRNNGGNFTQQLEGTHHTIRLGNHLHIVAVTAHATNNDKPLSWGQLYYYNLFFEPDNQAGSPATPVSETAAHLDTPGILNIDPANADALHRLVYPENPLPSFVLAAADVNGFRIVHGSCRKPHAAGREMLSALDTILETAIQQGTNRPQQLFLTGDQIYADDVAAPLLFALTDAGDFLFQGNEEEVLPIVNVPTRNLAPMGRTDIVRNKALFTTTTSQNHLLSLSEYAAMYLFDWSDILWPEDLPATEMIWKVYPEVRPQPTKLEDVEEQYTANLERLQEFRSKLPQVRRALANIATYTICDDHEITDDWFLDGRWCRQVLANPLGRRVIRNGILTYALFQAWGNTPEQFSEQNGTTLLKAIDTWRGDEADPCVKTIEEILGLPTAFSGTGELPHSERALRWHYTYTGPNYQVIVMDTRNHRLYPSPGEFPGLLSPEAMQAQVASAARKEAEVTVIISATPVIGVDFIESIQFWSRWGMKENYSYDREAWALEWGTFQHFLKTVSTMKRVVFLSGDVHYAFGSSMEYWDAHTKATAKFVDYTSSALSNEGAGSQIAILAIGYPRLLRLLRKQGTPTVDFFAWDINAGNHHILNDVLALIRQRFYLFWWSVPRLIAAHRSPYEIVLPARGWLEGAFKTFPPDRIYRIRYLRNTLSSPIPEKRYTLPLRLSTWILRPIRLALGGVTFLQTSVSRVRRILLRRTRRLEQAPSTVPRPARALAHQAIHGTDLLERRLEKPRNRLVATIFNYARWMNRLKAGELIIGCNNLGEISFEWNSQKKEVIQRLWWQFDDPEQPLRRTEYHETLELPAPEAIPPLP